MYFYPKMISFIEVKLTPLAAKLGQQRYIIAIRDGFIASLPFMIIGSFMLIFISPPFEAGTSSSFGQAWLSFASNYRDALLLPFNLSMGIMTLFIAVGAAASLAKEYKLDPINSGLLSLTAFLVVAAPIKDGSISMEFLSGQGIFTAIFISIFTVELQRFLIKNKIGLKLPKEVPEGVARSFELLIPVIFMLVILHPLNLFIQSEFGMIIPEAIMSLVKPLVAVSDTLPAFLLAVFVCQLLWFAGVHGASIVTGIMAPFWLTNLAENQAAFSAGDALPNIFLQGFWDHYLLIGGVGSTLPVVLLLLFSKSAHLRSIGKLGGIPSLFNINEPILFGTPIVMNPVMFIPFVFTPMINAVIAYAALETNLVARVVTITPWTTPAPIGASWAANWALSPVILCFFCMLVTIIIYLPFIRAYEQQLLAENK